MISYLNITLIMSSYQTLSPYTTQPGLENAKSLSGLYGVGDLVGSQILIKNTEANAIKTFTKKLDNAYKNKK